MADPDPKPKPEVPVPIPSKPKDRGSVPNTLTMKAFPGEPTPEKPAHEKTVLLRAPKPKDLLDDDQVVGESTLVRKDARAPFRSENSDQRAFLQDVVKKPPRPEGVAKTEMMSGYVPGEETRKHFAAHFPKNLPQPGFVQGPKPEQPVAEAPREIAAYKATGEKPAAKAEGGGATDPDA